MSFRVCQVVHIVRWGGWSNNLVDPCSHCRLKRITARLSHTSEHIDQASQSWYPSLLTHPFSDATAYTQGRDVESFRVRACDKFVSKCRSPQTPPSWKSAGTRSICSSCCITSTGRTARAAGCPRPARRDRRLGSGFRRNGARRVLNERGVGR